MNQRTWHLDIHFEDNLFSRNWDPSSHSLLLRLFQHIEANRGPVISMLPPGVSPAGAAAAASFYFLPGLQIPPKPHCRIALFPGLHFVRQMKMISFDPGSIWRATQRARAAQRGYSGLEGPLDKLRQRNKETEPLLFHWLFRCQRSWTRYRQKESIDLLPRAYFGRNDPYLPIMDFIETEHLELFSDKFNPYDLLIYCPYFHSRSTVQTEQDLEALVAKVSNFSANRKLIVARSPFDYWSRRLEQKFSKKGIALSAEDTQKTILAEYKSTINFVIVNQFIDLSEARTLFEGIRQASRGLDSKREIVNDIKFILRRVLVSLDPKPREGEEPLADLITRLENLSSSIGMDKNEAAWNVIQSIKSKTFNYSGGIKLDKLREMVGTDAVEIWVTKDLDRQILSDFKIKYGLDINIRLADRWMAPGSREHSRSVILSRIDREGDLDLTAYLKGGDTILMSAWEATVRGASIMTSWERSERWRDQAVKVGIVDSSAKIKYADPVLDLANYLDTAVSIHESKLSPHAPPNDNKSVDENWWDDHDTGSILESNLSREQMLETTGANTFPCRELRFDGGFGMFVRHDSELQIIGEESDGDILAIPVSEVEEGMVAILFKDTERNSLFDIIMDQLERSDEHQHDARFVRQWKERIRDHVIKHELKISAIAARLSERGRSFDPITVRSWIFGSTMAPLRQEHLEMLVQAVGIQQINTKQIFKSVKSLRTIARALGKALNEVILRKDLDQLDAGVRSALINAGIDIDELSSAIETRRVAELSPVTIEVEARSIRKLFKVGEADN